MFAEFVRSKRRWVACVALSLATLFLVGMAGRRVYRDYTLGDRVAAGRVLFEHEWEPGDALAKGDGLGPVFNEKSCVACHFQGGTGGAGPNTKNVAAFEVLPVEPRRDVLVGVVHASATRPELQELPEQLSKLFPIIPGGTTVVSGCVTKTLDFDPVVEAAINTPSLFGAGLIDELSAWAIHGDGLRRSAQGISENLKADFSGTPVGRVRDLSVGRVGRFGWKGQFATLEEFVASACAVELGLTNPLNAQSAAREYREDADAALDMTSRQLDELVSYVAALPRPVEVLPDDPAQRARAVHGKSVFATIGCADCHTPDLGGITGIYSDFRLYEVEPDPKTADYTSVKLPVELPGDHPKATEWKTPPLWGVADTAPYFHDGGSPTLVEAILRHNGAAKKVRQQYKKLSPEDRQSLLAFLGTLKAPR
jgi:CxxC motif-containing protein (DUF1111 family)